MFFISFEQPDWRKMESGTKAFENYVHPVSMGRDNLKMVACKGGFAEEDADASRSGDFQFS